MPIFGLETVSSTGKQEGPPREPMDPRITDSIFPRLPATEIASAVSGALRESPVLVVTAPPGAGKSTVLPLTILRDLPPESGKILMLEPRRLAAKQIAHRLSETLGEEPGQTVGYRIRFESRVSERTRIEVLTEGILSGMLTRDPALEGVCVIIFDEFHERSIHSDLALALARQAQKYLRDDLRIVVMSATIDTEDICQKLSARLIECTGRQHPVQISYSADDTDLSDMAQATARAAIKAFQNHEGDILVFLPGQGEITRCAAILEETLLEADVCPLYGNLPWQRQQQAIRPNPGGRRRIVVSTPIAETSLTIEGIRVVIDSGFCRTLVYDHRTGLSHLRTVRISQDMATQRAGRAGRVAPGICHRLWTKQRQATLEPKRRPEILDADLTSLLLETACFGEKDAMALPWLTPPPGFALREARQALTNLGAISEDGAITPLGRKMAGMPCHPRMSRMILGAGSPVLRALASDIAAILEERDPLDPEAAGVDLTLRVEALRRERGSGRPQRFPRIIQIAREYLRLTHEKEDNGAVLPHDIGFLVASAYPERIATASDTRGVFRLSGGENVLLDDDDDISTHEYVAVASLYAPPGDMGRVLLAAPVHAKDLLGLATTRERVFWNSSQGCVQSVREERIGRIILRSTPIFDTPPDAIISAVCEAVKTEGLSLLEWDEAVRGLQRRVSVLKGWHPEMDLPDLSTPHLLSSVREWLPPFLYGPGKIISTQAALKRINLHDALWSLIPFQTQEEIDRLAPVFIQVPSGSRIRIDYREGAQAPVLSVRLQECFGLEDTPRVDGGKRSLLLELLSPGFKPVQLTQDLRSFWKDAYFEVRGELRRRYPKHYWPDNPLEAEAVKGVRRR